LQLPWDAIVAGIVVRSVLWIVTHCAALTPDRDVVGLSDSGRVWCVYVAEALVVVLMVHNRLTMRWLIGGLLTGCWPFVVMLVALVSAGLSDVFERQGRTVIVQPLERRGHGALLGLIAVIGHWVAATHGH
jgi:hypothetical protein